jgi:hypothetical protein
VFSIQTECELFIESIHIKVNQVSGEDVEIRGKILLDSMTGKPVTVEFRADSRAKRAVVELLVSQGFRVSTEAGDDIESRDLSHTVGWPHTRTCNLPEEHEGECACRESRTDYREEVKGGKS